MFYNLRQQVFEYYLQPLGYFQYFHLLIIKTWSLYIIT